MRLPFLAAMLAALTIAACGEEDVPSERDVSQRGSELAQQTRKLQEDVTATARSLVDDPQGSRERASKELQEQEREARELADQARNDLPEEHAARDALVRANERTAQAVGDLREFVDDNDEQALERARSTIDQGQRQLRRAADELLSEAPTEDARRQLEDARGNLPDIPSGSELPQP